MSRSVLITGCSAGGIGSALAMAFAKNGCRVFATARNPAKMVHFQDDPSITVVQLDPTSAESVHACFERIQTELPDGKLDVLVNNAGMATNAPVLDVEIDDMKAMYEVNFWGCVRVTQKFAPMLIKAEGKIVFNSSISSVMRVPFLSMYSSSKTALNQFADTLRLELAPFNVRVITLMTGSVKSEISKKENVTGWRLPENSLYRSIERHITDVYTGTGVEGADTREYATHVAKRVLSGRDDRIWKGKFALFTRIMTAFFPRWVLDLATTANSGIKKLEA